MLLSLLMLVVFQTYWLKKVYVEQKELLNKEIDNIFVQAIRDMQDSLFRLRLMDIGSIALNGKRPATMIAIRYDSLNKNNAPGALQVRPLAESSQRFFFHLDTIRFRSGHSTSAYFAEKRSSEPENRLQRRERFYRNALVALKASLVDSNGGSFSSFLSDTLNLGVLQDRIRGDMERAGLSMPIVVTRETTVPRFSDLTGMITFYPAGMPPINLYVARISGFGPFLFGKMIPSLLFACFLIGITSVSFILIFRSLQEQHKLAKLKNDFIGNITHELKTPISTVSVALEALQNFQVLNNPERTKEYLSISQHELQRLSILVDRVLKMSMFEQNALQLHLERFDVQATLQKIMQSMGLQFEKAHATVHLHVEGEQFSVEGDAVHLTNVFYNLLDNALKYSPKNPSIEINLKEYNGTVQISVEDKGIGIEKEYHQKIFEQFFRAPQEGNRHNTKGYGLGLSYVAEVVRGHGGEISVKSVPGKGSTFTVTIPKSCQAT
jgi:two-component system phosphate regulon sensor histidine kinase PhoR